MGLIRKSLMISTGGVVRGSSKKQRVARKQLNELKQQTRIMAQQEQREQQERRRAAARNGAPAGTHEERMAELQRIRQARNDPRPAAVVVTAPPAEGWYPDPEKDHLLRWWDGTDWTARTAPRVV